MLGSVTVHEKTVLRLNSRSTVSHATPVLAFGLSALPSSCARLPISVFFASQNAEMVVSRASRSTVNSGQLTNFRCHPVAMKTIAS